MDGFFSVNNIVFTVIGYPMSYIEFFGTLLNIWCVYLVAKNKTLNWPVGIVATILFGFLFFQINLYADFLEQIYFLLTGFWGWWAWSTGKKSAKEEKPVLALSFTSRLGWILITFVGTLILGYVDAHLNVYFPKVFTEAASFPYLDSFTTIMSFVATILLIHKEFEAWYLWILVDIIGIWLYWIKDVHFVSILYVIFFILAVNGLTTWRKLYKKQQSLQKTI
ncbi:nicotinamide mononucleotide transporter [Candidatus Campbellbacteria bacterium]|nr:MAG: nicotinamide mononucleotide transporter [Candidatus Campbellbacteria bacterium]